MRLTTRDVARIRELRYGDGLSTAKTAQIVGCAPQTVLRYAPGNPGKVPNDKLRAAFEASNATAADVARHLGWDSGRGADTARVRRALGINRSNGAAYWHGPDYFCRLIDAETAALMAEAIGVMPWEVMPDDDEAAA